MGEVGLDFRVLIVEALNAAFVERFWAFVEEGGYELRERSQGKKVLYRFQKPKTEDFPAMLELFSRSPEGLTLAEDSHLTPLPIDEAAASLSAILLDEDYCAFLESTVRDNQLTEVTHRIDGSSDMQFGMSLRAKQSVPLRRHAAPCAFCGSPLVLSVTTLPLVKATLSGYITGNIREAPMGWSQKRAIQNYRTRLSERGLARFEVLGLDGDRDLIRSFARCLAEDGPDAVRLRATVAQTLSGEPPKAGGILAALRRSPLVGADLDLSRPHAAGRKIDL